MLEVPLEIQRLLRGARVVPIWKPNFIHLRRGYFGEKPTFPHLHITQPRDASPLAASWVFKLQSDFYVTTQNAFTQRVVQWLARLNSSSGNHLKIPEPHSLVAGLGLHPP